MLSPQALFRGLVSTLAPASNADSQNNDVAVRMDQYGGVYTQPRVRKTHALAKEGYYFVANNGVTGVTITTTAGFDATKGFLSIYNANPSNGRNIYIDYIALITTTAGSAASALTNIQAVFVVDAGNRFTSGGTALTGKSANMANTTITQSAAIVNAGQLVTTAASSQARTLAFRTLRPCVSATVADVVGESKYFNFGGVEDAAAGTITVANANIIPVAMPCAIIGPGQTAVLYLFYAASNTPVAAAYAPEIAWWEE